MTMHNRPESLIEQYFVNRVERDLYGIALKLEVKGRRGWPEHLVLLSTDRTYFVELKAPGGRLSRGHKQRRKEIEELDHNYIVLSSKENIDDWVAKRKKEVEKFLAIAQSLAGMWGRDDDDDCA